jgi:hypothetical protein
MCEYSSQRPGEVMTTDFIDSLITNNFRLIYVPNKTPDLPNENVFHNGMCPVNVKTKRDTNTPLSSQRLCNSSPKLIEMAGSRN